MCTWAHVRIPVGQKHPARVQIQVIIELGVDTIDEDLIRLGEI